MFKKFQKATALVALAIALTVSLSACDSSTVSTPVAAGAGTVAAGANTVVANASTAVVGAATQVMGGSMDMAGCGNEKAKVGLVTDVGKVDDKGFNQSAWEGVQAAAKKCSYTVQYIETVDPKDYATNIQKFVDQKYNIIVTVGFLLAEGTQKAAVANPNIKFIGVDQFIGDAAAPANYAGLVFNEDQSGYLAGVLAASVSKSGSIGAVLGTDNVPPVYRFGEGYKAGAKSVKADIKVSLIYHEDTNAFNDPAWGAATAKQLISGGADVIFGCGGKTGNGALEGVAQTTTADKPIYAIGVDTDQYMTLAAAQKVLLSSATKELSSGTMKLIMSAASGSLKGGNNYGTVALAPFHDLDAVVTAAIKTKLDQTKQGLDSGAIKTGVSPVKPK